MNRIYFWLFFHCERSKRREIQKTSEFHFVALANVVVTRMHNTRIRFMYKRVFVLLIGVFMCIVWARCVHLSFYLSEKHCLLSYRMLCALYEIYTYFVQEIVGRNKRFLEYIASFSRRFNRKPISHSTNGTPEKKRIETKVSSNEKKHYKPKPFRSVKNLLKNSKLNKISWLRKSCKTLCSSQMKKKTKTIYDRLNQSGQCDS